ncbi:MAG: SpoIID/LytB domain-containing protein [Bacteroidetes bacterium]|nr:SpoIID/LytB domain-containing protein [Bacteroidota bacterium]
MSYSLKKILQIIFVLVLLFFGLTSFFIPVENIQIRIFSHLKVTVFSLYANQGTYKIIADGNVIASTSGEADYKFSLKGDSVELSKNDTILGTYKYLKLSGTNNQEIKLRIVEPDRKGRVYQGNISCSANEGTLKIINEIELDNYIAGVTEAEAGSRTTAEFYKVQTILARTFALAHINKHITEGFSLCDQVHCQAYFGKPRDYRIFDATEATKGQVVVDENLNLIVAAFHSNSGGQTANSEDVWGSKTSYLRSIVDTFSIKMPNARWERKMLTEDWLLYLKVKHNFPVDNAEAKKVALHFQQPSRKVFLECNKSKVPLKNVRQDLQLKSTFFSISPYGKDSILIKGRGYGHGLGMCQEGAMRMSKLGYKHTDILNFYYQNIQLIDLHKLSFFRDE